MRDGAGIRRLIAVTGMAALLAIAVTAPAAPAAEIDNSTIIAPQHDPPQSDDGWQAGTCLIDTPPCSVDTPAQFFEQAAGHPPVGFTQFIIKEEPGPITGQIPVGNLKTVRVDLPEGLTVNPQATPQCELDPGESPSTCPANTQVGTSAVTATNPTTSLAVPIPPVPVYNIVPKAGEPALFGLSIAGNDVYLEADIEWEGDYHEYFTIHVAKLELSGIPGLGEFARIAKNRLVFDGRSGNGTFITTPSTCYDPETPPFEGVYSTYLRADSYEDENPTFPVGSPFIESPLPPEKMPLECETIPFDPSISVDPSTTQADSPAGAAVDVEVPFEPNPLTQLRSHLRTARVTLPAGMGLNPSAATGLQACSDADSDNQFRKGVRDLANACPPASKIGTVAVDSPPLPDGSLTGDVYLGRQIGRDPASGQVYRIFVEAKSERYDIDARLIGNVSANPLTGQLTTTFAENPQVPFKSFRLKFRDGATAPLTSPPTCGPNQTSTEMTPWSGNPPASPTSSFGLTSAPGGGECAKSMAARPFAPSFGARTTNPKGGAFTNFAVNVARSDGNQELKGVDVKLPPGLTAKLAGVRYCPEAAIAAAAASAGGAEAASSSCPGSSLVGSASVTAGSGPSPIGISGRAFLAGPYHGAPLSLAVLTPATAGPFDLGTVVVRVALFVDPRTAQVNAVSDPIPHVFGGATLDIRSVAVTLDRKRFAINPTNCSQLGVGGTLRGGGANPLDPAAFSSLPAAVPFQVKDCDKLDFKPKLYMRIFGGTRRAKSPKLRAILKARDGDANIGRAAVTLPNALILEQSSLANVCTRIQFAAHDCPKDSIYGYALAETPLLDGPLKGPVYLRSSDNELPDMVAALNGQVDIELAGRIDSTKRRLRTTFDVVPDVPVSKFTLTVRGGKKRGLLVNTRSLCGRKYKVIARFKAHNGKKANMRPKLRTPCKKKGKGSKGKRGQR
jgi:hypothetical protein